MKVLDKKIDGKTYYKYRINLPKDIVESLKFQDKEVNVRIDKNRILIERK